MSKTNERIRGVANQKSSTWKLENGQDWAMVWEKKKTKKIERGERKRRSDCD